MNRLWRLLVLALVAVAPGTATTTTATSGVDCSVAVVHTAQPGHGTELKAHIDGPRRSIARAGTHVGLTPQRCTTTDRRTIGEALAEQAAPTPNATSHRAVGDRAPPTS